MHDTLIIVWILLLVASLGHSIYKWRKTNKESKSLDQQIEQARNKLHSQLMGILPPPLLDAMVGQSIPEKGSSECRGCSAPKEPLEVVCDPCFQAFKFYIPDFLSIQNLKHVDQMIENSGIFSTQSERDEFCQAITDDIATLTTARDNIERKAKLGAFQ